MQLLLLTGMSGAGKSQALYALEDMGYFCVHNLPSTMLLQFVELCKTQQDMERVAVCIDMRGERFLGALHDGIAQLRQSDISFRILFLDAADDVLMRRFKETRRLHPMQREESLEEIIRKERQLLQPMRDGADYVINTSAMLVRQLKVRLTSLLEDSDPIGRHISVISFGYKYGLPAEADYVMDMRFIPNPFHEPQLRERTGLDLEVKEYVLLFDETRMFLNQFSAMIDYLLPRYGEEGKNDLVLAIGCTGGMHRSVVIACEIQKILQQHGWRASVTHRDIDKDRSRK